MLECSRNEVLNTENIFMDFNIHAIIAPFITFVLIGLLHNKMCHKLAGIIGAHRYLFLHIIMYHGISIFQIRQSRCDIRKLGVQYHVVTLTDQLHIDMGVSDNFGTMLMVNHPYRLWYILRYRLYAWG